jgi:acyl-coenzyme A thioesterase PaaI-like protein
MTDKHPLTAPAAGQIQRVLRALHANRTPGWQFPGYYLGICFDTVDADRAAVSMPIGAQCLDSQGRVALAALAVLADVAMVASLRLRAGVASRIATVSMRLSFAQFAASETLVAHASLSMALQTAMPLAISTLAIAAGGTTCCTGEASFALLDNRRDAAPHPLPRINPVEAISPVDPGELNDAEQDVFVRARTAAAGDTGNSFLERFWGLVPQVRDGRAECRLSHGLHVGNRVGDIQGGILLGLAIHTSVAVLPGEWQLVDIAAQFVAAAPGKSVLARAEAVRIGRNIATIECRILDEAGNLVLTSSATFASQLQQ